MRRAAMVKTYLEVLPYRRQPYRHHLDVGNWAPSNSKIRSRDTLPSPGRRHRSDRHCVSEALWPGLECPREPDPAGTAYRLFTRGGLTPPTTCSVSRGKQLVETSFLSRTWRKYPEASHPSVLKRASCHIETAIDQSLAAHMKCDIIAHVGMSRTKECVPMPWPDHCCWRHGCPSPSATSSSSCA